MPASTLLAPGNTGACPVRVILDRTAGPGCYLMSVLTGKRPDFRLGRHCSSRQSHEGHRASPLPSGEHAARWSLAAAVALRLYTLKSPTAGVLVTWVRANG